METQRIPKAVLTLMKKSCHLHKQYSESLKYEKLSESFLSTVLSELKSNQRKALLGPDNITAAGIYIINDMTELVKSGQLALMNIKRKELLQRIESLTT